MSNFLWSAQELADITQGTLVGEANWSVKRFVKDARLAQSGDLFIGIKGERFDGSDFAQDALAHGATAALVHKKSVDYIPAILVDDSLRALERLAQAARKRFKNHVFAITGSVGKTSTKEMLATLLRHAGVTYISEGNLNNHIGLPFTLAQTPRHVDYGVFELGMSHAMEISPLSQLLKPNVAIITNIAPAHIQNFEDGLRGIALAKAEIFDGLSSDGIVILPRDSQFYELVVEEAKKRGITKIYSFGKHEESDACLLTRSPEGHICARLHGKNVEYTLSLPGEHMAINSGALLLAMSIVGLDVQKFLPYFSELTPLKGRGMFRMIGSVEVLDECYNASPTSMEAAIRLLSERSTKGRKIAVLGEMLELGDMAPQAHAALADILHACRINKVYCCGENMLNLWNQLDDNMRGGWAIDSEHLAPKVINGLEKGDVVLVKGSRGQQVAVKGVMSPTMAVIIAAIEDHDEEVKAYAV